MSETTDTMQTAIEERDTLDHDLKFDRVLLGLYESDVPRDEELIEVLKAEIEEKELMLEGFYRLLGEAKGLSSDASITQAVDDEEIESHVDSSTSSTEEVKKPNHGISGPISPKEMQKRLEKGGFHLVPGRGKGSHTIFRNDEGISVSVPVHGDLGKGLAVSIIRQAGLKD